MADPFASQIEALEHLWMRCWMQRDRKQLKGLTRRDFILLLGSDTPVILDRASWLEAATAQFHCRSYQFGDIYVRRHGALAVFASRMDLSTQLRGYEWSGQVWLTDLWMRGAVRRDWRLVERCLSRPDQDYEMAGRLRQLQLWR